MRYLIIILCLLVSLGRLSSQEIFNAEFLHKIEIKSDFVHLDDTLISIYRSKKPNSKHQYLPVQIIIDGVVLDSVGIRYKGASSYRPDLIKKSLKLDFNEYKSDQRFQNLKKINLHNSYADPSYLRDPIAYHLMDRMGVYAPRTAFAEVWLNGSSLGLYQIVEQVDNKFVEGALFKNIGWNSLQYQGSSIERYKYDIEMKGKVNEDEWKEVIDFLRNINTLEGDFFADYLKEHFNIEQFLKVLAVYVFTDNYDSILGSGRNWYLAKPDTTNRYLWIPWDQNLTFSAFFPSAEENCDMEPHFASHLTDEKTIAFFDLSTTSSPVHYSWDFGDGNTSSVRDPQHSYKKNGKYQVCLSLSLSESCSQRFCQEINTRKLRKDCFLDPSSQQYRDNKRNYIETIDHEPKCCEQWTTACDSTFQNLESSQDYTYDFFAENSNHFFVKKILNHQEFKQLYEEEMCNLIQLAEDDLMKFIDSQASLIQDIIANANSADEWLEEFQSLNEGEPSKYHLETIIKKRISILKTDSNCLNN